jgi:hypothetical protein
METEGNFTTIACRYNIFSETQSSRQFDGRVIKDELVYFARSIEPEPLNVFGRFVLNDFVAPLSESYVYNHREINKVVFKGMVKHMDYALGSILIAQK